MVTSMELSSNITVLPCEVLMDILTRLSVKHVHQLKMVSKFWFRIISCPHFKKLYNMKSMTRPRALITEDPGCICYSENCWGLPPSRTITVSTMDFGGSRKIQKECSFEIGCERPSYASSNLIFLDRGHKVCNPTTREVINIPHKTVPSFMFEAGYISSTNAYKIVNLFRASVPDEFGFVNLPLIEFGFETLTLTDGGRIPTSWRSIAHREWFSIGEDITCADAVMYWLVKNKNVNEKRIISMELATEEFMTISCPCKDDLNPVECQLADLNGKLCLAYYSEELLKMGLFLLKNRENQTWVKEYNIDLSGIWNHIGSIRILGCVPRGGNDGYILFNGLSESIIYDVKEGRFGRPPIDDKLHSLFFERCFTFGSTRLPLVTRVTLRMRNLLSKIARREILRIDLCVVFLFLFVLLVSFVISQTF